MCPIGLVARFAICFADGRVQAQVAVQRVFGIALGPALQAGNTRRDATFDRILCNISPPASCGRLRLSTLATLFSPEKGEDRDGARTEGNCPV
jgi:hypothetical protein